VTAILFRHHQPAIRQIGQHQRRLKTHPRVIQLPRPRSERQIPSFTRHSGMA
jgi:hypothetical protein